MHKKHVMIVDDEKNTRLLIESILIKTKKYHVTQASNGEACLKKLDEALVDLVVMDIQMPGLDGIQTLKKLKNKFKHLPVLIMTAHGTVEKAVESMRAGAYDFIVKPFQGERLKVTVRNALEASALETEVENLRSELEGRYEFDNIVGKSREMQSIFREVEKVIDSDVTVLIQGESGTGKELVARAIHNRSQVRKDKPFVPVNCTALPESLLESELFGHEKGAFTGAAARRIGKFESADGGTIFLDEIGDMSLSTQSKILRVLQEREFERLGGNKLVKVNIRLISATNKHLEEEVHKNTFRVDLFYRISVFPIKLPPLRERKSDIPLLASYFCKRYSGREKKKIEKIDKNAIKILMGYHWPGNVRELENVIERAVVISNSNRIGLDDLPKRIVTFGEDRFDTNEETLPQWLEKLEVEILRKTLLEFEGNVSQTARKLGIGRATIYRKARKHNLTISR